MSDEQTAATPAAAARDHLATIQRGWKHVLNPIRVERGATQGGPRAATEDDLELPIDPSIDTPVTLAFWVHAAIDEWPHMLERRDLVPQPTTDPSTYSAWTIRTTLDTINCSDVHAMCDLLDREADRLATWVEGSHDFGGSFVEDLARHARAVSRVAWPPKGDRMVIGECPACGSRLRVKAPAWRRVPQPTTDPDEYPPWSDWHPDRDRPIVCRCGLSKTLTEWREILAGPSLLLTAEQIVADVHEQLGMRYDPATVRQWARRGLIRKEGESAKGHALYDRTQVLAALMAREKERERVS